MRNLLNKENKEENFKKLSNSFSPKLEESVEAKIRNVDNRFKMNNKDIRERQFMGFLPPEIIFAIVSLEEISITITK